MERGWMDEEEVTLDGQFREFARVLDTKRCGLTIDLWRSDYWFRQAKLLDDRYLTMTDTGVLWFKDETKEKDWDTWYTFMCDICVIKGMEQDKVEFALTNCGSPGVVTVVVPQYREFFHTYKPKSKLLF